MTVLFIWTYGQVQLGKILDDFNGLYPNLRFTHNSSRKNVTFLDVNTKLLKVQISTEL